MKVILEVVVNLRTVC